MSLSIPATLAEMETSKKHTGKESKASTNCITGQFSTLKLSEKSRLNTCPHCPKMFGKPSGLKAHIYSHTGEKPHQCPTEGCHRHFSLLSNLRRHIKTHNKAEGKTRSSSTKRPNTKILPLLSTRLSNGNISFSEGSDDERRSKQSQLDINHGTVLNHDASWVTSSSTVPMISNAPMGNNITGHTMGGNHDTYDNNNQSPFSFPYTLIDWMDSTHLTNHNQIDISKEYNQIQTPTTCTPCLMPFAHGQIQLDWTQYTPSHQQDLNWVANIDHQ